MPEPGVVDVFPLHGGQRQPSGHELARLASKQYGVVSVRQLYELGLTDRQVEGHVAHARLHRLYRGVYAVGHVKLTREGRLTAALLAAGGDSFLSHRTAASIHGLRQLNVRRIDVTVVGQATRSHGALKIHRTRKPPVRGELTTVNGLNVSTVPRLLVELAATETQHELTRLITEAVRKRAFAHDNLERALTRHAGRPGVGKLKAAYAAYRPHPDRKSDLERAFDRLLDKHPEIPAPLRNVHFDIWELDCYWPEHNLALELDGRPYHLAVQDIERDRLKDAKLLTNGIRPLRITDQRFELDPEGAIADLKLLLQLG